MVTSGTPQYDAVRWLAQLSVNIVDFIDRDDFSTPFQWRPGEWVYGVEQPRLVLTEAYAEIANDPTDPKTGGKATKDYKVNFWVELYNPWWNMPTNGNGWVSNNGSQDGVLPNITPDFLTNPAHPSNGDNHVARLKIDQSGSNPAYSPYTVVIATQNAGLRKPNNVQGDPDPNSVKTTVNDFTPEPPPAGQPAPVVNHRIVRPKASYGGLPAPYDGGTADGNW